MPSRIQYHRGKKLPPGSELVTRPSRWGDPFLVALKTPEGHRLAVEKFRAWVFADKQAGLREQVRQELRGFDLACCCKPGWPCHADVWLEIANQT